MTSTQLLKQLNAILINNKLFSKSTGWGIDILISVQGIFS